MKNPETLVAKALRGLTRGGRARGDAMVALLEADRHMIAERLREISEAIDPEGDMETAPDGLERLKNDLDEFAEALSPFAL